MRNSLFWRNSYIMMQGVRREWYDRTAVWEKWERWKNPGVDRIKGLAGRDGEKRRDDYATKGVWLWCSAQQQYFALNITALWQLHMIFEWHFAWNFCIIQYTELLKKVFQVYSVIPDFWINCFLILPIQASLLALLVVFVFSCSWSLQCASNM